jgi:hypothetical protein
VKSFFMFILLTTVALYLGHGELQPRATSPISISKESAIYFLGCVTTARAHKSVAGCAV